MATKPAFRAAFKRRRCLVPMAGYYEWSVSDVDGKKDPWFIHADAPLWAAGLWEDTSPLLPADNLGTFTIVTGDSSGVSADIHDRMPVWLDPGQLDAWFTASPDEAMAMLLASEPPAMEAYRVSRAVNTPRNSQQQRAAAAGRLTPRRRTLPHPAEGWRGVQLGQPVRAHSLPPAVDGCHVLAEPRLMPGHPQLSAGAPLLIAGAPPGRATGAIAVAIQQGDAGLVVNAMRHGDHPHPITSDHRQRITWPAGGACRPVEVGGQRHGRQDTAGRRKGCDNATCVQ